MMIFAKETTNIKAGKHTDSLIKNDIVYVYSKLTINTDKCDSRILAAANLITWAYCQRNLVKKSHVSN